MSAILVKTYRGNLVENIYRGDISIVNQEGKPIFLGGDDKKATYWRSAAKPIQVIPVICSGAAEKYNFTDKEISTSCKENIFIYDKITGQSRWH